jgi:hypothetical protein
MTIPSAPSLTGYRSLFRLWHYPAFQAHRSWTVFKSRGGREPAQFLVRQVAWDRAYDHQRLREPLLGLQEGFQSHPKIEVRDRPLGAAVLAARLSLAKFESLPVVGLDSGLCVDGASFGYEEQEGERRLEWCCDGPADWREFTTWAGDMMRWLHEICVA